MSNSDSMIHRGSAHGLVVCGAIGGDWFVVGIGHEGHVRMWHLILSGPGSTRLKPAGKIVLENPVPAEAQPMLGVRVSVDGTLEISIDDVLCGEAQMGFAPHPKSHVGVFVLVLVGDKAEILKQLAESK